MAAKTIQAERAFNALSGLFCVYKEQWQSVPRLINTVKDKLCAGLNKLEVRPPRLLVQLNDIEDVSLGSNELEKTKMTVTTQPDIADHPLVIGPRYLTDDLIVSFAGGLSNYSSGVIVLGIGRGGRSTYDLRRSQPLQVYHLCGKLGRMTHNYTSNGRTVERTTWRHVTPAKMDRIVTAMQAAQQKHMFMAAGVSLDSDEAYHMAAQGLIRPEIDYPEPVIYKIKCIEFRPPEFILEIHTIGEKCPTLFKIVHDLGIEMKSSAVCTNLRRVKYGHFSIMDALVKRDWTVEEIIQNIFLCKDLFTKSAIKLSN